MSEFDVVELHRMIHDIVKDAWFILFLADKPAVDVVSYFGQFSGEGDDEVVCPKSKSFHSWKYETEWGTGWPVIHCVYCGLRLHVT